MKVLLTATVQSHICQFHKPLAEVLHKCGYEVHVAARDNLAEKNGLKLDFVDKVYNVLTNADVIMNHLERTTTKKKSVS